MHPEGWMLHRPLLSLDDATVPLQQLLAFPHSADRDAVALEGGKGVPGEEAAPMEIRSGSAPFAGGMLREPGRRAGASIWRSSPSRIRSLGFLPFMVRPRFYPG